MIHQLPASAAPFPRTDSSRGRLWRHEDNGTVALGPTVRGHTNIGTDNLASLPEEILEVLPRGHRGDLSGQS